MTTFVHSDEEFVKMYKFRTQDNQVVLVKQFEDGIATIEPTKDYKNLDEFAKVISGCLDEKSNFKSLLLKAYGHDEDSEFLGIDIIIVGISIFIPAKNMSAEEVIKLVNEEISYVCGNVGEELVDSTFHSNYCEFISSIIYSEDVEFVSDEARFEWEKQLDNFRGSEKGYNIVDFATTFAIYVQYFVRERKKDFFVAMDEAIEDIEPITNAEIEEMEEAIYLLTKYWKYREELIMWRRKIIEFQVQYMLG